MDNNNCNNNYNNNNNNCNNNNSNYNNNNYSNNNYSNNNYSNYNNGRNNYNPYSQRPSTPKDNLGLLSLIFGAGSILTSMLYFIGIPLAVTSIVLAILSRNRLGKFEGKAIVGLCIGISGICLGLLFFAVILAMFNNPELVQTMQDIYNSKMY